MTLQDLLEEVLVRETRGDLGVEVRAVRSDSRKVVAGDVFVAVESAYHDGPRYIDDALERGASALVVTRLPEREVSVPVVVVPHAATALGQMAAAAFGHPSRKLDLIGITGTNGKTTTAMILDAILLTAGRDPGLLGTAVGARYAGKIIETGLTTPEAPELQAILADMVECGVKAATMEVSSHGIALKRVEGCAFAIGVFTGLGSDHLDYHQTLEEYAETKVNWMLADVQHSPGNKGAVVPADDDYGMEIHSEFRGGLLTFGFDEEADIYPTHLELTPTGTQGRIATPEGTLTLTLHLPGRHNVRNAMAAIGGALLLGVQPIDIVDGLSRIRRVPGRFDPVPNERGIHVLVDYAHTADALAAAVTSVRELAAGRVIVLFGCGGDRDKAKRPEMAKVAFEGADVTVVTSDNPRSEDPAQIIADVLLGVPVDAEPGRIHVEQDREAAIRHAIGLATAGDVVLIAGKGHETGQTIGDQVLPFDDREVAGRILAE